jgi:DNA invertase Pin-like site-specific DNA recombinase
MRAVGYVRKSRAEGEDAFGLTIQRRAIKTWARSARARLVEIHADDGKSGSNGLSEREALADALDLLRDGQAEVLVVPSLDRLARDLIIQEQLIAEVRRIGGEVRSAAAGEDAFLRDDPDDPSRRLIRQVLGAVSEYERAMAALRLRRGRRAKIARDGWAGGPTPYGWRTEGKRLITDPSEQSVIRHAKRLRGRGASLREIARALETNGQQPRSPGASWHPVTIARMLGESDGWKTRRA